jgi:hypothetical protein
MSDLRAFLSFDYDNDATSRTLFAGQADSESPTSFVVQDWSSKTELPEEEWEEVIAGKISRCHMLIVLVGQNMGSAYGVAAEIAMAKDKDVPVFGVYVNGGNTLSTLPSGLPRSRVVAWNWSDIGDWIDQCMTEGKNA